MCLSADYGTRRGKDYAFYEFTWLPFPLTWSPVTIFDPHYAEWEGACWDGKRIEKFGV
jgi:hypothetical protein